MAQAFGRAPQVKLRESYDWIVVGDHPAAVLSGALVAKLGLSVLQLSFRDSPVRKISRRGQWLEWESNWLPGFAPGALGWHLLKYLGARPVELASLDPRFSSVRIESPSHRLLLEPTRLAEGLEELEALGAERLWAASDRAPLRERVRQLREWVPEVWIQSLLGTVWESGTLTEASSETRAFGSGSTVALGGVSVPQGWKNPTAMQDRLSPWWFSQGGGKKNALDEVLAQDAEQLELVRAWVADLWGTSPDSLPAGAFPHSLAFFEGTASFKGGKSAVNSALARLAARAGVQVVTPIECRKIFTSASAVTGVQTNTKGGLIRARGIALGCGTEQALELLASSEETQKQLADQSLAPAGWKFTLALTVSNAAFSPPFTRRMLWSEEGAPLVEVEWAPVEDFPLPERGRYLVFLRTTLPWHADSLSPERLRVESARLLAVFDQMVPRASSHIVRVFPDFRSNSQDFSEAYPYESLSEIPEALRVYPARTSKVLEKGPSQFLGLEGLFLCNGESCGPLGRLGLFSRAIESAAWVAHRSGLSGPFASRQVVRAWGNEGVAQ